MTTAILAALLLIGQYDHRPSHPRDRTPTAPHHAEPVYPSPQSGHVGEGPNGGGPSVLPGPTPSPRPAMVAADPYGFGPWLNSARAQRGLRPLAYDPALAGDCATNSAMGFGHGFFGRCRRQNAGQGALATVCGMWLASPAHASALFDPSCTAYGIAHVNGNWTFGAY